MLPTASTHADYTVRELLHQGGCTTLYRALRSSDHAPVVLKVVDARRCRPKDLERLRHEYEIGFSLETPTTVRPLALDSHQGMPALVLEDFGGQPLERLLGAPMPVGQFLDLAVRVTGAVAEIHRHGVIHKDLKPENILVDPATNEVKLADFGIATRLPREQQPVRPLPFIEGSLPYMSPEQTGRMNRAVDSRSDLYSLGVTFFQMLTGRLPFEAHDPLEWIHCHVAREPPSVAQRVPSVPEPVARIVSRLLAKMADERYQSARGLRHDLERCLAAWRTKGRVDPFPLGERDLLDQLRVPQKLYGRSEECSALLAAFERAKSTREPHLLLVSGGAGVGKSSLVHELLRPLARERGLFLEGKFDPYATNVPYSTIVQALGELALGLLADREERRAPWAEAIREALGGSAGLVTEILPSLKLVLGEPPPLPEIPPIERERLVRRALCAFVQVFSRDDRPLVLFFDDLQWADPASLALLETLVTDPGMRGILVAGAYRPEEVSPCHPLSQMLDRLRVAPRSVVAEVVLSPLRAEHVVDLLADTLRVGREGARPLATLIVEKTQGNPLFIVQSLAGLEEDGLLRFDDQGWKWRWDLERIAEHGYAADVSDLLARKITTLPAATRDLLETVACLGSRAPLALLAAAHASSEEEALRALEEAMTAGIVVRARDGYAFAHDRVQQAAYTLIPEARRSAAHLRIGRHLLGRLLREQQDEWIFEIVTQLDLGLSILADPAERLQLAELNLRAGRKAFATAAYVSALAYFAVGDALLPQDGWESRYELTHALKLERARCEWLSGHLDAGAGLVPELLRRARGRADLAAAYLLKVSIHTTQGEFEEASRAALAACSSLFGVELPLHPGEAELREAARRTLARIGSRPVEDLLELPEMTDPAFRTVVALLAKALPGAYWTDPNLHDLICCQIVDLTLQLGASDGSPHAYVMFGAALGRLYDDWDRAVRLGRVACELVQKRAMAAAEGSTYFTFAAFIQHWVLHAREVLPLLRRARRAALEHGDMNIACYAANAITHCRMRAGCPLDEVAAEVDAQLDFVRGAGYREIEAAIDTLRRAVLRLRGLPARDPDALAVQPVFRRQLFRRGGSTRRDGRRPGGHGRSRGGAGPEEVAGEALADFLLGGATSALRLVRETIPLAETGADRGLPGEAEFSFVSALVVAAHLDEQDLPADERARDLATVEACEEKLRRWRRHGPANFGDRHALVAAELARLRGRHLEAMQLYEEAIAAARESGFVQDEAMSLERAAAFHRQRKFPAMADGYLREARACYLRWQAYGKVAQLERLHPQLIERRPLAPTATAVRSEQLDLLSVVKASQTISGEMEIEKLIGTLLQVALEQGGGRRGCLVLARGDALLVEAEASIEAEGVVTRILPSLAVESSALLPASLVQYARRTRQPVIVEDVATDAGKFAPDPYFSSHRTRSVLCLPIVRQAELVGLLYLENRHVAGAFTPDRLTALSLLASQAAISVENALLLARERAARAATEEAERRSAFLAEAGVLLSESLEYRQTLHRLPDLCVKSLADWCVIDLVESGELRRLHGACADPMKEPLLRELRERYPARWDSPHPAARSLRAGEPVWVPTFSDELLRSMCEDDDHLELLRGLGTRSAVVVPLVARGQTLGVISLISGTAARYTRADLELAEEVAHRAAIAIDNARLYRETQRALRLREEFLLLAAHELRTPMTPLSMSLKRLQRWERSGPSALPATIRESVELASRQADRLNRLVSELLDVSRIESGQPRLDLSDVDLEAIVRASAARFEPELARARCPLSIERGASVTGRWDASRLDQVVTNLVSNAIKFGAGKPIEIHLGREDGKALLSVRDHGIGLDPAHQARIFERFERAVSVKNYGGLGLGLYISRRIVEAHEGRITVESQPGAGSNFVVELPCAGPEGAERHNGASA